MSKIRWDDLVFVNRNRSYGAYILRREYPSALIASFVFMLVVMALLTASTPILATLAKKATSTNKVIKKIVWNILPPRADTHTDQQKKIEPPVTRQPRQITRTVITQQVVEEAPRVTAPQNLSAEASEPEPIVVETTTVAAPVVTETDDPNKIWTIVEQTPEFPGGISELMKFIGRNTKYPASARRLNVEGSVFISFVVDADGTIDNVQTIRGISPDCDREAMRVVAKMPQWKAGKQSGKAVKVRFVLPVKFKLGDM